MSLSCKLGYHTWNGCKCSKCGKIRNEQHSWIGCTCSKCGKTREHLWNGCKCNNCGIIKEHIWSGYNCINCSEQRNEPALTDIRDGYIYKCVKIGNQIWMAENLKYYVSEKCLAYDNDEQNFKIYGYLYDYYTAQKICPNGWHLPTNKDWEMLADFLGGKNIAGDKLKLNKEWDTSHTNENNSVGFLALPGGNYEWGSLPGPGWNFGEKFNKIGTHGYWWSDSIDTSDLDKFRICVWVLINSDSKIFYIDGRTEDRYSVRYVMD